MARLNTGKKENCEMCNEGQRKSARRWPLHASFLDTHYMTKNSTGFETISNSSAYPVKIVFFFLSCLVYVNTRSVPIEPRG